jgi:uncharacterized RDD family membrane protein YckC
MSSMDSSYEGAATSTFTSARAGFWRRFAAAFIDGVLISIVGGILNWIVGYRQGGTGGVTVWFAGGNGMGLLVGVVYFTYFHGRTGQTPGNAALSIRVVGKDDGAPVGHGRAFLRWLVSLVSGIVLLLGYLWMLWDSEKQTWHDKAANAVVVPTGG